MKNSGKFFIGIAAAATAGVIIGMLIAPENGEKFRNTIKETAGDWTKKLGDLLAEGKEHVKSLTSSFEEGIDEFRNEENGAKA